MDELTIINSMLAVVGEHPVSSADSLHPTVVVAKQILETENAAFQGIGWFFNTEYDVTLKPAADGRIVIPSNTLHVTSSQGKYTQRLGVLYNLDSHTSTFTEDVSCTIIVQVDIPDLPPNAAEYLRQRARLAMFTNDDGEGQKTVKLEQAVNAAYATLRAQHINFIGVSFATSPQSVSVFR